MWAAEKIQPLAYLKLVCKGKLANFVPPAPTSDVHSRFIL